jgi:sphingosine kinase
MQEATTTLMVFSYWWLVLGGALAVLWCLFRRKKREVADLFELVEGAEKWRGKRVCVLYNPVGGNQRAKTIFQTIVEPILQRHGVEVEPHETKYKGHAQVLVREELDLSKYDAIMSISGDGSIHEIINGYWTNNDTFDHLPPIATIPAGTANGLCASFGARDPVTATKMFLKGSKKNLDLMIVKDDAEERDDATEKKPLLCLMIVHWGVTADYDYFTENSFRGIGSLRSLVTALMPFYLMYRNATYKGRLVYKPYDPKTGKEGETVVVEDTFTSFVASTVPWIAHDACLTPKAELTDGCIDLYYVVGNRTRMDMLRAFTNLDNGNIVNLYFSRYAKTKHFTLEPLDSKAGYYSIDGVLTPPKRISVTVCESMGKFVY